MAIKRVTYDTLKFLVAEIKERYAEKGDIELTLTDLRHRNEV